MSEKPRSDGIHIKVKAKCEKWKTQGDKDAGKSPYEQLETEGNLGLNEGLNVLLDLLIGAAGTVFSNANAYIGVGNSATAAQATDTGLLGASKDYQPMEATYPSISAQTLTAKSEWGAAEGNFAWEEWTFCNGNSDAGDNLNRKVQSLGTKASPEVWTLEISLTVS